MTNENNYRNVTVLGGAGFIGRHVAAYFAALDETETVTLVDIEAPTWTLPKSAVFIARDVREPVNLDQPADLIVNLAAVHRTPGHPDHEYHETNETGAQNAVDLAIRTGAKTIWFTSSIAVYGPNEFAKTEATEPTPVSAYGKSKLAAEGIHRDWAEAAEDRKLVIARAATVFGQGEGGNFTRLARAMRRHTFAYPGRRDTLKACGYVKDLPRAFEFMDQFAAPSVIYNFAYPTPPEIQEICLDMAEIAGYSEPKITLPPAALTTAGRVLSSIGRSSFDPARVEKLMYSTNVVGQELKSRGFEFKYPLAPALRDWYDSANGEFV